MQQIIQRTRLLSEVILRLEESPSVALLGARQVGKTTLAEELQQKWKDEVTWFDLEVAAERAALESHPGKVLESLHGLVVIDEVQRLPELFEVLRPLCDRRNQPATFLLLGSASWDLIRGVSETLAGRIQFVDVPGFSMEELHPSEQDRLWFRGGFPRAFLSRDEKAWARWMEGFARTFLERDVPGMGSRVSPQTLGRFWRMLAHFHGQTWNAAELARSMDVSVTAVNHYRDLLAGTFMVRVLPPWNRNFGKRLVKSPKVYLTDSGVLHHFIGLSGWKQLVVHPRYGASWEGFALQQILSVHGCRDAYFYGTQRGAELDLLLDRNGKFWGFECKAGDAPRSTKSMHIAIGDLNLEHLWVVYPGTVRYPLAEKITALPLQEVSSLDLVSAYT
jgi:predicted AAA+ superfamily ATPase